MQEKIKVLTIGDYQSSILENHFKNNENIEFLEFYLVFPLLLLVFEMTYFSSLNFIFYLKSNTAFKIYPQFN